MVDNAANFLNRLRKMVLVETDSQNQALQRQWRRPLRERILRGHAIEGLKADKIRSEGSVIFSCLTNHSRFRDGDFLILHKGNPKDIDAIEAFLEYEDENYLEIRVNYSSLARLETDREGWIADEGMLDLTHFYIDALEHVADSMRGRELILPLLTGEKFPMLDLAAYEYAWEEAFSQGLNESQAEAAACAYASDLYHLIQGPPGTGKTWVLAHLVRMFVEDGQRVLVTALTHRAINNALNKVLQVDSVLPVCKIGQSPGAKGLDVPNYKNFAESEFGELTGGYVIGATPFATRSERLSNVEFDVVLFDEASQITLPLAIMGMLAGTKYIFIGDDCQLPPVTTSKASKLARTSIFGHLSGRGQDTMLKTTYRLNAELARWPSQMFYDGELISAPSAASRHLQINSRHSTWDFALDPDIPAVFLNAAHKNVSVRGRTEAEVVAELVAILIDKGIQPDEIGVVTPYRAQGRLIRSLLGNLIPDKSIRKKVVVDTVERMQGQEREVVLVSLTTSNPDFAAQIGDFYFQPERLNVAITRPKTKLILVGSREVLKAAMIEPAITPDVELFKDLLDHCTEFAIPQGRPI